MNRKCCLLLLRSRDSRRATLLLNNGPSGSNGTNFINVFPDKETEVRKVLMDFLLTRRDPQWAVDAHAQ